MDTATLCSAVVGSWQLPETPGPLDHADPPPRREPADDGLGEARLLREWATWSDRPFHSVRHNCCVMSSRLLWVGRDAAESGVAITARLTWRMARHPLSAYGKGVQRVRAEELDVLSMTPANVERLARWIAYVRA